MTPCEACPFLGCPGCEFQPHLCDVDGCDKPRATGYRLCRMHRARLDRHGDVNRDRAATVLEKAKERFWAKVDKTSSPRGCWLWTGDVSETGYGYFRVRGVSGAGAHRFAWRFSGGEIPDGMQLDHLCRVRSCVNPAHLEVVTPQVNTLRGTSPASQHAKKDVCPRCGGEYSIAKRGKLKPGRYCVPCHSDRRRQRKAAARAAAIDDAGGNA